MLKACRTLSMTVRGPALDPRCRGGHPVWSGSGRQQSCSWMDRQGRPASPPPLNPRDSTRYGPRTRKVELCIEPGQSLGLMIRGGLEYGLGIYVTGVDKDSVADRAGLLVSQSLRFQCLKFNLIFFCFLEEKKLIEFQANDSQPIFIFLTSNLNRVHGSMELQSFSATPSHDE